MADSDRRSRAEARQSRIVVRKTTLHADDGDDLVPIRGAAAVSLVHRLTREAWALARLPEQTYSRAEIPVRFLPRSRP